MASDPGWCTVLPTSRIAWAAHEGARRWAHAAAQLAAHRFSDATRATWLGNLAELVAAEHVGVGSVGGFWRELDACMT